MSKRKGGCVRHVTETILSRNRPIPRQMRSDSLLMSHEEGISKSSAEGRIKPSEHKARSGTHLRFSSDRGLQNGQFTTGAEVSSRGCSSAQLGGVFFLAQNLPTTITLKPPIRTRRG